MQTNKNYNLKFYEINFSKNLNSKSFSERNKIESYLLPPYDKYEKYLNELIKSNHVVLDMCVGDGIHSVTPAKRAKSYYAVEPSISGLKILEKRLQKLNIKNYKLINSTIEEFYIDQKFDLITIINSISYFDIKELHRIISKNLNRGGRLIIIDSLNNNIFYRINHYIHFLKGDRTLKTINRIFSYNKLQSLQSDIIKIEKLHFYGPFLFLKRFMNFFGMKKLFIKMAKKDQNQTIFAKYSFKFLAVINKEF